MKSCLVVGGSGCLGSRVVSRFIASGRWETGVVDLRKCELGSKSFSAEAPLVDTIERIKKWRGKVDSVVHVAGGFQMGNIAQGDKAVEAMWTMNAKSAFAAAYFASHLLSDDGLFVLTGAKVASKGCPTAFATGYGMSKAATHQLAVDFESNIANSSQIAFCILPTTIDTPANRAAMPDANFGEWSTPESIAEKIYQWSADSSTRPEHLFVDV